MQRGGSDCVVMERKSEKAKPKTHLIFAYGTLKRGFPNHYLMEELMSQDDAVLVGSYSTEECYPLVCGPHGIPYLINLPGSGHRVKGEVYAVSEGAVAVLDEFEGVSAGCYERLPVAAVEGGERVEAEAYWGHRRFGELLWKTKGEVGLKAYGVEEMKEYVRKENRSGGRNTILDLVP
ncbi:unnamed protein product [Sphenostylis stenocarpa]|uniref:Gamma-glutamylcyclotransferase family protein n=1 Tax=Sphenostylis stenocarpa TaxID=92480 RepID=A0AA86RUS5_9FABA|nr:unnamed protein product [Sphenostylis stenocarpa]